MNLNLEGEIALVTGAGGGIGARTSAKLVAEGCTVYVTDLNADAANVITAGMGRAARAGGVFGNVLYGTTKAGVVAFTKGFARDLAAYGINVNAVAPGLVETAMTSAKLTPDIREQVLAKLPMHRLADVEDIANAVVFLASDMAAYITGETLLVDGGYLTV